MKYKLVACGGTFDHLHKGHKEFLRFVSSMGENVIIGLTSDAFVQEKKADVMPFSIRKKALEHFLGVERILSKVKIVPIDTIYGPAIDRNIPFDALIVTGDTKKNGDLINLERQKYGLRELPIILMPIILSENMTISSSNIRKGIMDEEGLLFIRPAYFSQTYSLPISLRNTLHKPFGKLVKDSLQEVKKLNPQRIVSIGDVTTSRFNKGSIGQKISVIDFVVERKKTFSSVKDLGFTGGEEVVSILNPPGMLTPDTWKAIKRIADHLDSTERFILSVSGEEDLVFIPLLLVLPLGFHLFYGQPHQGLVQVDTTLENKRTMGQILRQFIPETTRGY